MKRKYVDMSTLYYMGYQAAFYRSDDNYVLLDITERDATVILANFVTDVRHNGHVTMRLNEKLKCFASKNIARNVKEPLGGYRAVIMKAMPVREKVENLECPFVF